ncbi:MAG: hypothetical protein ABIA21_00525 [Candidatus Aenigmatarchaeota archaeon]
MAIKKTKKRYNNTAYGLMLAGGLITLIAGIAVIILGILFLAMAPVIATSAGALVSGIIIGFGVWGIICSIVILLASSAIKSGDKHKTHTWGIIGLVFSILSLMTLQGVMIGPILVLVSSILVLGEN